MHSVWILQQNFKKNEDELDSHPLEEVVQNVISLYDQTYTSIG